MNAKEFDKFRIKIDDDLKIDPADLRVSIWS